MKFSCFLFSIFLIGPVSGQVIINGTIKNYDGKTKVAYQPTVDGILPVYSSANFLDPKADGTFQIKYESQGLSETRVLFNNLSFLFIQGEKSVVNFTIDQSKINFPKRYTRANADHVRDSVKQATLVSIEGDFAEVNRINNRSVRTSARAFGVEGNGFSILMQKAATPKRVTAMLDSLIGIELANIDRTGALVQAENQKAPIISAEAKKILMNEVYAFYGSAFLNGMLLKRIKQVNMLSKNSNAELSIYNKQWEELTQFLIVLFASTTFPAANSYTYNEFVYNVAYTATDYKKYDFNSPAETNDELIISRLIVPKFKGLDSLFLRDPKVLFAYKIQNLSRFLSDQTFYSPTLLNAVAQLEHDYPGSSQLAQFKPQVEKLRAFLKAAGSKFDKAEFIKTNYVHFADLLERFKGHNLLIDIWATWCGPCHEDFPYKTVLKPLIDEDKIKMLYISIDKETWADRWKESIKYNQLEGVHVLANDVLITDMWGFLKGKEGLIPRFVLIDKAGNIFMREATRTSVGQGQVLLGQINQLLEASGK